MLPGRPTRAAAGVGGYSVSGLAIHGVAVMHFALLWGIALLLAGLYEELIFRSYPLYTLVQAMGFWPAAVLLSIGFGALHYFGKPGETWVDGLSVTLIGLFFCFSIRRTGDVVFAIGWHSTWNYGSLFLFGSPNTGNGGRPMEGHLLAGTFHGPEWLTGGGMGVEASVFVFVTIALLFLACARRFPRALFPAC
jgi:hypothetical protein